MAVQKHRHQIQKFNRFSFIRENKPAENFYTRVYTHSCHSSGIQTDFNSQKHVRIDCRLLQKKATNNFSLLCSSLPQLTNRNIRTRQIPGRREVEYDLRAEVRGSICPLCCRNSTIEHSRWEIFPFKSVS